MDNNFDNLKRFITTINAIGFWGRLFGWKQIKRQVPGAAADLQKLLSNTEYYKDNLAQSSFISRRKDELETEVATLKTTLRHIQADYADLQKQNTQLEKDEAYRKQEHANSIATLEKIQERVQAERAREVEERNEKEVARLKALKETWSNHQEQVKNCIKSICQRYTIEYIDKVPFRGEPDNTVKLCDEYVVLDAKSPAGDELTNFPNYLKDQAAKAAKYARQENVKPDIFFVVPSNALEHLSVFVYRHGDHTVFIVSIDALEPVLLSLQKIEAYEFAEQLSPEDRENICRVLGRFAHLSKRRIQVDSFFAKQFIELAYKCETDLPKDVLESVKDFERAEKLNPPQEKRAKAIAVTDLENESNKVKQEAESRGILIEDETISNSLNELPLYKNVREK